MTKSKKKSTAGAVPIHNRDHGTTPKAKSEAEILFDKIGTGNANAVKRPINSIVDRQLRRLIQTANMNGDCIINDGSGYFRPGEDDEPELRQYLLAEIHRSDEIRDKVDAMREAYYGRY